MKRQYELTKAPTSQQRIPPSSNNFRTPINKNQTAYSSSSDQIVFKRHCNHPYLSPQLQYEQLIDRYFYEQHQSKKQTTFNKNLSKILFKYQNINNSQVNKRKCKLKISTSTSILLSPISKIDPNQTMKQKQSKYTNNNIRQLKHRIFYNDKNIQFNHHNDNNKDNNNIITAVKHNSVLPKQILMKLKRRSVYSIYTIINQQEQPKLLHESFSSTRRLEEKDKAIAQILEDKNKIRKSNNSHLITDYLAKTISSNEHNESSSYFTLDHVFGFDSYQIFGVCNGIGPESKVYPSIIKEIIADFLTSSTFWLINREVTEDDLYDKFIYNNCEMIKKILIQLNDELIRRNYDSENNGSTLTLLFIIGKRAISVNLGNDDIIVLKKEMIKGEERLRISSLTEDHSITNINERIRIKHNYNDFKQIEVTRALGLIKYNDKGLLLEPYISFETIDSSWKAILLGTKRVWKNCLKYNICKVFSTSAEEDLTVTMNKILQFKKRHLESSLLTDFSFSIIMIKF